MQLNKYIGTFTPYVVKVGMDICLIRRQFSELFKLF